MALPAGTVTMLFSDIEGSTRLLEQLGERYADVLGEHHRIVRSALAAHGGAEIRTEGDAFFAVFTRARDAALATAEIQRGLAAHAWPESRLVRVRIGVHTGEPNVIDDDYQGLDVHRAARICSAAHGGQVLISDATAQLVMGGTPIGLVFDDLGEHRLKDLSRPERLFQLTPEGLDGDLPPLRTLGAARTNLPALPTSLIGRRRELDELTSLLREDAVRLVTLTGPGGTGKTRLALSAAAEASGGFPGGAQVAFLAGVEDADHVLPAVAAALAIRDEPGVALIDSVASCLDSSPPLLVLDNLEHLLDAAPLVAELLARVPSLTVMATSRAPLHVNAEREVAVPPLPDADAARLFVERARAVRSDFELADGADAAVTAICHRLDGLPLAIELAAARTRVLSPEALLARLDRQLDLLVGGPRDAPDRHRTLRATIAASHELLAPAEQALLRRLAVFAGGFPLDLVAPVAAVDDAGALTGVEALVEQSLLRPIAPAAGEPRYLMLETIRAFAREQLDERGETDALRERHAAAVVELLERAARQIKGAEQVDGLDRIDAELDNVRAAIAWMRDAERPDLELRVAAAIGLYGVIRGRWSEVRPWAEHAVAHGPGSTPESYARALASASWLVHWEQGAGHERRLSERLLEFADEHGDRLGRAHALMGLALAEVYGDGDPQSAMAFLEEAAALCRDLDDDHFLGIVLNNHGDAALNAGDLDTARERFAESLAVGERRGLPDRIVMARGNLATALLAGGDAAAARPVLLRALRQARDMDFAESLLYIAATLVVLKLAEGKLESAARLTGTVEAAFAAGRNRFEGFELHRHEHVVAILSERLGRSRFEALRAEGGAMPLGDMLDAEIAAGVEP